MKTIGYGALVGALILGVHQFGGSRHQSGGSRQAARSTLYVAPNGRDIGACSLQEPCTFDRAYHAASPGATVEVAGGLYPQTDASARTTRITHDGRKKGPGRVTFVCGGQERVRFAAPAFTIQADYVTIRGACFRFHRVYVSQRGTRGLDASHITFDSVHMDTIEIAGADNVTVRRSEIGPMDDCYAPGRSGTGFVGSIVTPRMWCDPTNPTESYWATVSDGTETNQGQPFVHPNLGRDATNIRFVDNVIHGIQTRDPSNLHSGGFLIQASAGSCDRMTFLRNRWVANFGFDMLFDGAPNCVTLRDNFFGPSYEAIPNDSVEIKGRPVVLVKTGMQTTLADWTVRGNSFAYDFSLDPAISYSRIRVDANVFGLGDCRTTRLRGVAFTANVVLRGCGGTGSRTVPFGYRFKAGSLVPEPLASSVVRRIFAAAAEGRKPGAIARALRVRKAARPASRRWRAESVGSIISDPVYLGRRFGPPGAQPPLVATSTWRRAQVVLSLKGG